MREVQLSILEKAATIIEQQSEAVGSVAKLPSLAGQSMALLDIGCGDGELTQALAVRLTNVYVTAIDPTPSKHFRESDRVRFVQAGVENLPFESNTFDVLTASLSLHHWADKSKGFFEAHRVLKQGGHLIIGDPLIRGWMENKVLGWLVQKTDGGVFTSTEELLELSAQAGFTNVQIQDVPKSMRSLFLVTMVKN